MKKGRKKQKKAKPPTVVITNQKTGERTTLKMDEANVQFRFDEATLHAEVIELLEGGYRLRISVGCWQHIAVVPVSGMELTLEPVVREKVVLD